MATNEAESKHDGRNNVEEEEVKASDFTLLQRTMAFCDSKEFSLPVRAFCDEHAHSFAGCVDDEGGESSLQHTELFGAYICLLEAQIEDFLLREGASQAEFYLQCEDVVDGKFTALFAESKNQWFVDLLHSWTDFSAFKAQMCRRCRERERERARK